jgi:hypothetical protein
VRTPLTLSVRRILKIGFYLPRLINRLELDLLIKKIRVDTLREDDSIEDVKALFGL